MSNRSGASVKSNVLSAALFAAVFSSAALAAQVDIEVLGVEKAEGQVLVALYDEASFLKKPVKRTRIPAAAGPVRASLGDLPEGAYAVVVIVDENGNGKLDFNAVGIPTEKMGFSNDASGFMGPPAFAAARIELGAAPKSIVINLR